MVRKEARPEGGGLSREDELPPQRVALPGRQEYYCSDCDLDLGPTVREVVGWGRGNSTGGGPGKIGWGGGAGKLEAVLPYGCHGVGRKAGCDAVDDDPGNRGCCCCGEAERMWGVVGGVKWGCCHVECVPTCGWRHCRGCGALPCGVRGDVRAGLGMGVMSKGGGTLAGVIDGCCENGCDGDGWGATAVRGDGVVVEHLENGVVGV